MDFYNMMERFSEPDSMNSFIYFSILYDDSYKETKRQVMTIPDAFSATGGFMTVIYMLSNILLGKLQSTIYFSSLIKSFYRFEPENGEHDNKPPNNPDDSERHHIHSNSTVEKIVNKLQQRQKLRYGLCEDIQNELKRRFCLGNTVSKRKKMFESAKLMVERDLDIRSI